MITKAGVVFALCLLTFAAPARADDPAALFKQANEFYRTGDFKSAYEHYEKAARFVTSADLEFDMGNAAFKRNQLGLSILHYERARRLNPRDGDIVENLKFAKSFIEYRVDDKRGWYYRAAVSLLEWVRVRECILLVALVYLAWIMAVTVSLVRGRGPYVFSGFKNFLMVGLVILLIPAVIKFYESSWQKTAVVTAPKVEARYGPSDHDQLAFRLVEGIEVAVTDERSDWYRIALVNGDSGWISKKGVEVI